MNPRRLQRETSLSMSIGSSSLKGVDPGRAPVVSVRVVPPVRRRARPARPRRAFTPHDPHRLAYEAGDDGELVDPCGLPDVRFQPDLPHPPPPASLAQEPEQVRLV